MQHMEGWASWFLFRQYKQWITYSAAAPNSFYNFISQNAWYLERQGEVDEQQTSKKMNTKEENGGKILVSVSKNLKGREIGN